MLESQYSVDLFPFQLIISVLMNDILALAVEYNVLYSCM